MYYSYITYIKININTCFSNHILFVDARNTFHAFRRLVVEISATENDWYAEYIDNETTRRINRFLLGYFLQVYSKWKFGGGCDIVRSSRTCSRPTKSASCGVSVPSGRKGGGGRDWQKTRFALPPGADFGNITTSPPRPSRTRSEKVPRRGAYMKCRRTGERRRAIT